MTVQKLLLHYEPKKENLLRAIKEIHKNIGYFSEKEAEEVARYFEMNPAAVYSVSSFYDETKDKKSFSVVLQFCDSASCHGKGADRLIEEVEASLKQKAGDENNQKLKIERISCQGKCLSGPIMVVNGTMYERVTPDKVDDILRPYLEK